MRVLVSADMEGATGTTGWKDVEPGQPAFERFRRLLTRDVNAAVEGAFDGGATEVVVNEAHDGMRNILIEELDDRAQLISGLHKPLVMMAGIDDCDVVFFVAYHARAGEPGVLAHTLTDDYVNVDLNGEPASEARLNAVLAGRSDIPVAVVSGDDVICAEAEKLFQGVRTAVVKYAIDNFSARCVTPRVSADRIREAARLSLTERGTLAPYRVDPPYTVRVTLREPAQAGAVSMVPGVVRESSTTVAFTSEDYRHVYGALEAMGTIAGTVQ
ncbi:MAG: M55 family metallopeptidase [Actinomycetota bacterium]